MKNELKYMLKIQVQEIFRTKKLFVLMYGCIIFFSSILYVQDFSMKVTANLVLIVWISLMTFLGIKAFIQNERESLFVLSKTPLVLKYFRLILSQFIINLPLFVCLGIQLLFMGQDVFVSLAWTILSYIFAIMLGLFLGNTVSRMSGLVTLLVVFAYNFFIVNPYRQMEYSFLFGINEYLFNLDKIHVVSLCKMVGTILLGVLSVAIRKKHVYLKKSKYISLVFFITGLIIIESSLFGLFKLGESSEPENIRMQDRQVTFINVTPEEYVQGVELLTEIQNSYIPLGASTVHNYEIEKTYLSSTGWKFVNQEDSLKLEGDKLRVNIYSLVALNFYEPSIVINNCDDFVILWKQSIKKYTKDNRYFKHIVDGAGEAIKRNAIYKTFGESSAISKLASKDIDSIYDAPITKFNYVKRIGLLVADKYDNQLIGLVKELGKVKLKTDKEFAEFLQEKFPQIYQDSYIHSFLERTMNEGE